MNKVVLASRNPHKLAEIGAMMASFNIELVRECDVGAEVDVEETGATFEENAYLKAAAVMRATGLPALADDSGIAVDALGGAPGIYSARYGFDDTLDDYGRLLLLLKNMERVPDGARQAKFVCVLTLLTPEGRRICARGEAHGVITHAAEGVNGFGYDPIFYYPPLGKTFAQLTAQEKNQVSHRAAALRDLRKKMEEAGYADR